jgi:hypothetical protein
MPAVVVPSLKSAYSRISPGENGILGALVAWLAKIVNVFVLALA